MLGNLRGGAEYPDVPEAAVLGQGRGAVWGAERKIRRALLERGYAAPRLDSSSPVNSSALPAAVGSSGYWVCRRPQTCERKSAQSCRASADSTAASNTAMLKLST